MTINQVQYVLTIAKCGSFSEAAANLFTSQPALSQQIKKLESELGYDLFVRTQKGICLSKDGYAFCENAQELISQWEDFQKKAYSQRFFQGRCIHIKTGPRVYTNDLFDDIVNFFENSNLEPSFSTEAGQDYVTGLRSGTIDVALDWVPDESVFSGQNDIEVYDLIWEPQCVLVSPNDPRRILPHIAFSELEGSTVISGLENSIEDRALKGMCKKTGISFNKIYRSDSIDIIMKLVRTGKGVICGPRSFASYYRVAAIPLSPPSSGALSFMCLRKNANRKDIVQFRNYIVDICRNRQQENGIASF